MKKYLCHDCAYVIGHELQWWDNQPSNRECENQESGAELHGIGTALIDLSLPVPPRVPAPPTPTNSWPRPRNSRYYKGSDRESAPYENAGRPEPERKPLLVHGIDPNDIEL